MGASWGAVDICAGSGARCSCQQVRENWVISWGLRSAWKSMNYLTGLDYELQDATIGRTCRSDGGQSVVQNCGWESCWKDQGETGWNFGRLWGELTQTVVWTMLSVSKIIMQRWNSEDDGVDWTQLAEVLFVKTAMILQLPHEQGIYKLAEWPLIWRTTVSSNGKGMTLRLRKVRRAKE